MFLVVLCSCFYGSSWILSSAGFCYPFNKAQNDRKETKSSHKGTKKTHNDHRETQTGSKVLIIISVMLSDLRYEARIFSSPTGWWCRIGLFGNAPLIGQHCMTEETVSCCWCVNSLGKQGRVALITPAVLWVRDDELSLTGSMEVFWCSGVLPQGPDGWLTAPALFWAHKDHTVHSLVEPLLP